MAATSDTTAERREINTATSNTSSRTSSMRKTSRRPPPGTVSGKMSVRTSMTGDSGMVSGSNSTVTDTDRRYLDVEGLEDSGKSTPSERSRDDLESGSPNPIDKLDMLDFSNNGNFSDQDFDDTFVKEKSKPSKLPKVLPKERNGSEIKSHKPPEPISPNKLPRYPNVVKNKKSEVRRDSGESPTRKIKAEPLKEKPKRKSENSLRRSKTEHNYDSEDEEPKLSKSNQKQRSSSPSKVSKPTKKASRSNKDTDDDDDQSEPEHRERKIKVKSNGSKREASPTKSRSPVKKSPVKKSKKLSDVKSSDESEEDIKPQKPKLRGGESPMKNRSKSKSPVKKTSEDKISKSERKSRKEISDQEEESVVEVKSPKKKNGSFKDSPTKTRKSQSQSPVKNGKSRRESSPIKKSKKEISKSEFKLDEYEDEDEEVLPSPKKSKKGKLSRSKSESASLADKKRNKSPVKKKRGAPVEPEYSDEDEEDDATISERSDGKTANGKPKPKRTKDVVFSDEEEDSPFGISGKGGKNYWRRNTYLDILKIEKERRETIKKMKDEKEKEKEKNGGKGEKKEKFIRDSFGNKVFLSAKGKKDAENDAPDNIDITVDEIVSKTLIISSQSNYGRNRDSLASMIKRKLKEDHYLRSLCQTDEWFLKSIVAAMVSFGPLIKVITKTQALTWIFLSRLTQFWTKDGKQPPGEKELLNDPETIAFASELIKLCYKLLVSDQVLVV